MIDHRSKSFQDTGIKSVVSIEQSANKCEAEHYKNLYQEQRTKCIRLNNLNALAMKENLSAQQAVRKLKLETETLKTESIRDKSYWKQESQRYLKKISILEQNKQLLQQEVDLLKREVSSKYQKICQLQQLIHQHRNSQPSSSEQLHSGINTDELKRLKLTNQKLNITAIQQKQQIEIVSDKLSELERIYAQLSQECSEYKQRLDLEKESHSRTKQTNLVQVEYYIEGDRQNQQKIKSLEAEIQIILVSKSQEIQQLNIKWGRVGESLVQKVRMLQEQILKNRNDKLQVQHRVIQLESIQQSLKEQKQKLKSQLGWYKQLLEQAKANYINAQLSKESAIKNMEKKHSELKQRQGLLKRQYSSQSFYQGSSSSKSKTIICKLSAIKHKTPQKDPNRTATAKDIKLNHFLKPRPTHRVANCK